MSTKIFKLVLTKGFTQAYYKLSEEERKNLWKRGHKIVEKSGAKLVAPYYSCRWSTDKYMRFYVMEYPDVEAAIADTANIDEVEFFRYIESETILGVEETG